MKLPEQEFGQVTRDTVPLSKIVTGAAVNTAGREAKNSTEPTNIISKYWLSSD